MTRAVLYASVLALWAATANSQEPNFDQVEIHVEPVQHNIYMLVGAGGNTTAQVGPEGVLLVDTQFAPLAPKLMAEVRKLSPGPVRYIINTHMHPDHVGGNAAIVKLAGSDQALPLKIIAHENVLNRLSAPTGQKAAAPSGAWPTDTYVSGQKEVYFNEEPVEVRWQPAAHTDGDSLVIFRRSDVVATGDVFNTESYPFIDVERGGGIQGEIDALNNIIDIAIPKHEEEGGTYIIPGHGRICDEFDVVEYRDMVNIVRDRVQDAIKKGMTLEQVRTAGFTKDYDARWSAKEGPGTADNFVTSIYQSLKLSRGK